MKVFLTGATGFVGRQVAAGLLKDGHSVKCLTRSADSEAAIQLKELGAKLAVGDILDADSLVAGAAGCQAVMHLVGIIFERRGAGFDEIHIQGTYNALAAASLAGATRFIHMSALGTGPDATGGYHRTKWAAEQTVRASGLDYTILRPSTIYGRGGEFTHMLASQIRVLPIVPVIGNGRYRMQPLSVQEVAACFSACLENDRTRNQIYEIGGQDQVTYDELIEDLCLVLDRPRFRLHIPVILVRPVAWLAQRLQSKPLLTTDQLNMLLADNVCDITRMKKDLGVVPVGLIDGLREVFPS
ncbi:MAG: complex I NDUFA9 subunit family protein [Thermoleophilia bacterium]